jgi:hypothetical protein
MHVTEHVQFVGLEKPKDIRRNILLSSKDIIEVLQRFENLKKLREDKLAQIENLRDICRETSALIAKLRRELPRVKVTPEDLAKGKVKTVEVKEETKTNIDKLKYDLDSIEKKLQSM